MDLQTLNINTCGILMPYEFNQSGRGLKFILLLISTSFLRQNHLKGRRFTFAENVVEVKKFQLNWKGHVNRMRGSERNE